MENGYIIASVDSYKKLIENGVQDKNDLFKHLSISS